MRKQDCVFKEAIDMKWSIVVTAALVVVLTLAGCASGRSTYYGRRHAADTTAQLTKADIIKMTHAQIGDGVIINMIKTSGSQFDLRSNDVVALADSGVSDSVINAMIDTMKQPEEVKHARAYYAYPPYWYGYWYDPFWDPWYGSFYFGFGPRFYRPHYGFYARPVPRGVPHGIGRRR